MTLTTTRRTLLVGTLTFLVVARWAAWPGVAATESLAVGARAPEITAGPWIGGPPLTIAALRSRVTLVEFWTYG
jgi:hypothetical protein